MYKRQVRGKVLKSAVPCLVSVVEPLLLQQFDAVVSSQVLLAKQHINKRVSLMCLV